MPAPHSERIVGVVLITVSAACFGALPIFARFTYLSGGEPISLLSIRFAVAGLFMLGWMLRSRKAWPQGRLLVALMLLGGVGYVGQSFSYFTALTMASASLVSLLLYLYPALVTLLAAAVLKERIDRFTMGALVLALAGSALVIGVGGGGKPLGIALGLAAAAIYSVYIVIGSRVTPRAGSVPATTVIILSAAAVFGVVAAIQRPEFPGTFAGWSSAGLVAGLSVIAIVCFFEALARLGPADASTISTLEPVVTVVLAWWALDESVAPWQLAGGLLILIAVVMLARRPATGRKADAIGEQQPAP
jgi:drug/metabolite transporter (DMT)-like permease